MASNPLNKSEPITRDGHSPKVITFTASRKMQFYQISRRELKEIGMLNRVSSACYAVSALFVGLVGGCVWDKVQAKTPPTSAEIGFIAACVVFALVIAGLGGFFQWNKRSELKDILSESE